MIRLCAERCGNWAQWVLLWPQAQAKKPETTTYKDEHGEKQTRTLVQRGIKFTIGPYLCTQHKEAIENVPCEMERIFQFIGAQPDGLSRS